MVSVALIYFHKCISRGWQMQDNFFWKLEIQFSWKYSLQGKVIEKTPTTKSVLTNHSTGSGSLWSFFFSLTRGHVSGLSDWSAGTCASGLVFEQRVLLFIYTSLKWNLNSWISLLRILFPKETEHQAQNRSAASWVFENFLWYFRFTGHCLSNNVLFL